MIKGPAHTKPPKDLQEAFSKSSKAKEKWKNITPLGRGEFICWITSAKKNNTRTRRVRRTIEELIEGKRRPCCWAGCPHRKEIV